MIRKIQLKTKACATIEALTPQPTTMSYRHIIRFIRDDRGEHAMEFLMILTFGIVPLIGAVFLLEDILKEYVAFGQIFVSSPFF